MASKFRAEYLPVQQHADGDKEQAEQQVAERPDVSGDLVTILGLAQQHAGQEATQRIGQADCMGQPGGGQGHQQRGQRETAR